MAKKLRDGPTLQEVLSATKVKCQRDNLAFDWCIYQVVSGSSTMGEEGKE